jgi:hypothetical protein
MSGGMAIAWYTPASWRQLQAAAGDTLCTYDEYVRKTEAMLSGFEARGIVAEKVAVDVEHMAAWCKYGSILGMHGGELFDIDTPIDDGGLLSRTQ